MEELDYGLLAIFVGLTIVNVILNTARTIITVKGEMFMSALISALAFGIYTLVVIYTVCELPMWLKVMIVALTNFVGVYIVKYAEMWFRKDRVWVVDVVLSGRDIMAAKSYLNAHNIRFTELKISDLTSSQFHIYSNTQEESRAIKELLSLFNAKYVVMESKTQTL